MSKPASPTLMSRSKNVACVPLCSSFSSNTPGYMNLKDFEIQGIPYSGGHCGHPPTEDPKTRSHSLTTKCPLLVTFDSFPSIRLTTLLPKCQFTYSFKESVARFSEIFEGGIFRPF